MIGDPADRRFQCFTAACEQRRRTRGEAHVRAQIELATTFDRRSFPVTKAVTIRVYTSFASTSSLGRRQMGTTPHWLCSSCVPLG